MSQNESGFKDPTSLTRWTMVFLCTAVAATLAEAGYEVFAYTSLANTGEAVAVIHWWMARLPIVLTGLISAVLVSKWTYRANHNARALGASSLVFSPRASVGWYFVPIANLWKPYQAMREIWQASVSPSSWKRQQIPLLLPWWWGLWVLGFNVGGFATWLTRRSMAGSPEGIAEHIGTLVSQGFAIPAGVLLLTIVTRIHAMQMRHYRSLVAAGRTPIRHEAARPRVPGPLNPPVPTPPPSRSTSSRQRRG